MSVCSAILVAERLHEPHYYLNDTIISSRIAPSWTPFWMLFTMWWWYVIVVFLSFYS